MDEPDFELHKVPKCALVIVFLAYNSLHNHAQVTTQRILNKFIEIKFSLDFSATCVAC